MTRTTSYRLRISIALTMLAGCTSAALCQSASEYNTGVAYYYKKDYKKALLYLCDSMRTEGTDANTLYYVALCYHYMKDDNMAKRYFAKIVREYPSTKPAQEALKMLGGVRPEPAKSITAPLAKKGEPASKPVEAAKPAAKETKEAAPATSAASTTSTSTASPTGSETTTAPPAVAPRAVVHTYGEVKKHNKPAHH